MLTLNSFQSQFAAWGQVAPRPVLVAYSGGADSTALVHLLHLSGVEIVAAHLHHGQRQEADEELAHAEAWTESLGIPLIKGFAQVPEIANLRKVSLEEAGRIARHEFLVRAAREQGLNVIATGHTRDDHIETILFHMARGTGLAGLRGIPWIRSPFVRPLRAFSRLETRNYCAEHGLWFHDDPSNTDLSFSRARLRARVVPELREVHPGFDAAMVRLAELAEEEDQFLDNLAARVLEQAHQPVNGALSFLTEEIEFSVNEAAMLAQPRLLQRRALRLLAQYFGAEVSFETLEGLLEGGGPQAMTLPGGLVEMVRQDGVISVRLVRPPVPQRYPLGIGETESVTFGWRFALQPSEWEPNERTSLRVHLDPARLQGSLHLRAAQPGDRIQPLGFEGTRKVSDLLSEAKLTRHGRACLPLVCDMVGPVWIPGVCLGARGAADENSAVCWRAEFGPLHETPSAES